MRVTNTILHVQLLWAVIKRDILRTNAIFVFGMLFLGVLAFLQWIFNIDQLWHIVQRDDLSILDKFSFIFEGLAQIFLQWNNLIPIALIIIAVLQALALTFILVRRAKHGKNSTHGMMLAVAGAGCVACGGSMLAPIISIFIANASIGLVRLIGNILLVLAVVLSYQACSKIIIDHAKYTYENE